MTSSSASVTAMAAAERGACLNSPPSSSPSFNQVEAVVTAGGSLHDLDRARVNEVRLSVRVVTLLEDDRAGRVVAPLDIAVRQGPVDLNRDRGEVRLLSTGRRAFAHAQRPPLRIRTFFHPCLRRSRATSALVRASGLVQNVTMS